MRCLVCLNRAPVQFASHLPDPLTCSSSRVPADRRFGHDPPRQASLAHLFTSKFSRGRIVSIHPNVEVYEAVTAPALKATRQGYTGILHSISDLGTQGKTCLNHHEAAPCEYATPCHPRVGTCVTNERILRHHSIRTPRQLPIPCAEYPEAMAPTLRREKAIARIRPKAPITATETIHRMLRANVGFRCATD